MATTTTKYPATITDGSDAGYAWSNLSRVGAADASLATCVIDPEEGTNSILCSNFGFALDAGATITDVQVEIRASFDVESTLTFYVRPDISTGVPEYSLSPETEPTFSTIATVSSDVRTGGGYDTLPTVAELNAESFGIRLKGLDGGPLSGGTWSIDFVRIAVTWEAAATYPARIASSRLSTDRLSGDRLSLSRL